LYIFVYVYGAAQVANFVLQLPMDRTVV